MTTIRHTILWAIHPTHIFRAIPLPPVVIPAQMSYNLLMEHIFYLSPASPSSCPWGGLPLCARYLFPIHVWKKICVSFHYITKHLLKIRYLSLFSASPFLICPVLPNKTRAHKSISGLNFPVIFPLAFFNGPFSPNKVVLKNNAHPVQTGSFFTRKCPCF